MWPLIRQARYLGRYREIAQVLVGHGFGYLVEQLGLISLLSLPRRLVMRMPPPMPLSNAARLREALVALGPTFVKLGQALSTRPDLLPSEFVYELGKLQDTVPPFPAEQAIALIEESFERPIDQLYASFERTPLAAASLGQVHAAVLHSGAEVAVKVQRPDIQQRIYTDLAILVDLAGLAQERLEFAAQYKLVDLAHEFATTLRAELDYRREAHNADRFRRLFGHNPYVHVPQIHWEYTDARVLTTERLYGVKLTNIPALEAAGIDRCTMARHCVELILEEIFSYGFFHSDPHPGNFFAMPGNVLGVVDYGQVGSLDRETTQALLLLLAAVTQHDSAAALRAMERMGLLTRRDITPVLRRDLERFTSAFVDRPLSEISANETIGELLALLRRHAIRLPGPLAMLLKAIVMMEGVGLQIDPSLDVFGIARPYVQRALAEQFSPQELSRQALSGGRELGEVMFELPSQLGDVLQLLNDGELRLQTRELELHRVSGAMIGAANRLAMAVVLAALILGVAAVAIAIGIAGWNGVLPTILLSVGLIGAILTAIVLGLTLLRGRE
ncbi:MAG: AarF/ABC1/UbiB kinase family protein [Oscillochloris sp.]|nr:AarF/ABC1/UbiB kinase family protein [Oscillochloris sp.]